MFVRAHPALGFACESAGSTSRPSLCTPHPLDRADLQADQVFGTRLGQGDASQPAGPVLWASFRGASHNVE